MPCESLGPRKWRISNLWPDPWASTQELSPPKEVYFPHLTFLGHVWITCFPGKTYKNPRKLKLSYVWVHTILRDLWTPTSENNGQNIQFSAVLKSHLLAGVYKPWKTGGTSHLSNLNHIDAFTDVGLVLVDQRSIHLVSPREVIQGCVPRLTPLPLPPPSPPELWKLICGNTLCLKNTQPPPHQILFIY